MNSNVYFTLETLGKFYTDAAKAGGMEVLGCYKWSEALTGPNLKNKVSDFRVKQAKKKIIDLSPLIASGIDGIDCEFWHEDAAPFKHISELKQIGRSPVNSPLYSALNDYPWEKCRPRMNHKMCHDGSKPIEGFIVRAYFDRTTAGPCSTTDKNIHWPHVKAIEYLQVEDGYAYPWEQAE